MVFAVLSRALFWFSRRHVFCNIFRGCFRGKLPVNNGAHEYLNVFLLYIYLLSPLLSRLDLDTLLSRSFRAVFDAAHVGSHLPLLKAEIEANVTLG